LLQEFFDKVEAGLGDGEFYTTSVTGLREKRADALIETYGVPKERPSRAALALLIEVGMLGIVKKRSPAGDRDVEVYTRLRRTMDDGRWTMDDENIPFKVVQYSFSNHGYGNSFRLW